MSKTGTYAPAHFGSGFQSIEFHFKPFAGLYHFVPSQFCVFFVSFAVNGITKEHEEKHQFMPVRSTLVKKNIKEYIDQCQPLLPIYEDETHSPFVVKVVLPIRYHSGTARFRRLSGSKEKNRQRYVRLANQSPKMYRLRHVRVQMQQDGVRSQVLSQFRHVRLL
jgi:hypothetical protein